MYAVDVFCIKASNFFYFQIKNDGVPVPYPANVKSKRINECILLTYKSYILYK